mgnify:CR=1 FL=1
MRKRLLSTLLAAAITLMAMPVAFAAPATLEKLPTPQVTWVTENGMEIAGRYFMEGHLVFTWTEGLSPEFYVEIKDEKGSVVDSYKDGTDPSGTGWNRVLVGWYADNQLATGTYTAEIKLLGDGQKYSDSDIGKSKPYHYIAPNKALTKPTNARWENGVPTFDIAQDEQANDLWVFVQFGKKQSDGTIKTRNSKGTQWNDPRPLIDRFQQVVNRNGAGEYYFRVRSTSNDILECQNSPWSEWSDGYQVSGTPEGLQGNLAEINKNLTTGPSEDQKQAAIDAVRKLNQNELATSMAADQTDTGVIKQLQELEQKIGNKVTVEVAEDSELSINANGVTVVGAVLGAAKLSEPPKLTISKPKETLDVPPTYKNDVRMDLSFGETVAKNPDGTLVIPVRITMPVPENIQPDKLRILHYRTDGSRETIRYRLSKDKKTISFVVTHLSPFVFAEEVDGVAMVGDTVHPTLSDALEAVKENGGTITLLKDTTLENAQYSINKPVIITGSGKISCAAAADETTCAFVIEENGSLTLDGVELDIKGTKNADVDNNGTGIDVQYGGSLILKNKAVLNLHDLERAVISSKSKESMEEHPGQFTINNSTFTITNIDSNASNGGDWEIKNNAVVTVDGCGDHALIVTTMMVDHSNVTVRNVGRSAIYGKELNFNEGANVTIKQSGNKLPIAEGDNSICHAPLEVNEKTGGSLVVASNASVTIQDCVNSHMNPNNTVYLPSNATYTNNGTVNATVKTAEAPEGSFVVTLVSNGKTVGIATVKENEKFTLPEAPRKSNYTFTGWSDGAKTYKVNDEVPITEAVVFTAQWKYNGSSGGSSVPTYSATVNKAENGSVAVSPKNASEGATVTVTPKPDTGYELDKLAVTDKDGKKVKLTDKGNGKFTFEMPASKVTVKATFKKAGESGKNTFTDVSSMDYFYDAVLWAAEKGVASGMTDSLFAPNASCTRAQMVTFLWRANGSPVVNYAMKFTDVPADAYYAEAVRWAVSENITSGISETAFAPDMAVTRSQTVTFLYRAAGAPAVSGGSFADVDANAYYADAVAWAVAEDITSGTSETTFSPDAPCTRGQIVTFLYRDVA